MQRAKRDTHDTNDMLEQTTAPQGAVDVCSC